LKVLLFSKIAYPVYVGCNALRNEFREEFLEDHFWDQRYCEGQDEATSIVCLDTNKIRGVCANDRVTEDAHGVRINIGEAYSGKEIWEPKVTRLSCVDAADNATSTARFAKTRGMNGHHADV
jgi:hypothetical protein